MQPAISSKESPRSSQDDVKVVNRHWDKFGGRPWMAIILRYRNREMAPLGGNFPVLAACNLQATSASLVKLSWTIWIIAICNATGPAYSNLAVNHSCSQVEGIRLLPSGSIGQSLPPNLFCLSEPFEGWRPAELAGWAVWYYGHDSAQAEVNKQSLAQWLPQGQGCQNPRHIWLVTDRLGKQPA